jgi:hypothetical protein
MRNRTAAGLAIAAAMLAVPSAAAAEATLGVDPSVRCYRERMAVYLPGAGFTPNGAVEFSRDGTPLVDPDGPIVADASGQVSPRLILPGLVSGQRRLTYIATDKIDNTLTTQVSLLVTATDVTLTPSGGAPNRLLTIRARGFFSSRRTLYAHVVRTGKHPGRARNMRIAAIHGSCRKATARKRLFFRDTAPGHYRVQFDTFRRYEAKRRVKTNFTVTVYRRAGTARATGLSPAS